METDFIDEKSIEINFHQMTLNRESTAKVLEVLRRVVLRVKDLLPSSINS